MTIAGYSSFDFSHDWTIVLVNSKLTDFKVEMNEIEITI